MRVSLPRGGGRRRARHLPPGKTGTADVLDVSASHLMFQNFANFNKAFTPLGSRAMKARAAAAAAARV